MTVEDKNILDKARDLYAESFNSLPFEKRKMLPDIFIAHREMVFLIKEQSKVLAKLQERERMLRNEMIKWYKEHNEQARQSSNSL